MSVKYIGFAILGTVAIATIISWTSYRSAYSYGNTMEQTIHARWEDNEQLFANFGQKVAEAVGVAQMQREDAEALYATVLNARYGDEGLQAQIAMISEAMPGLDGVVYQNIQRIAEAGRDNFSFAQTQLTDAKREYRTALGNNVVLAKGWWLDMAGYPQINIGYPIGREDDYKPITSQRAAKTFESGVECGNALTAARGTDDC